MSRIIYSLKIYLFRSQFRLTKHELNALRRFNIFVIKCYVEAWYTSPNAASAPHNDLTFFKRLHEYRKNDQLVSTTAVKAFSNHLWYLNELFVGLSFFNPNLSHRTKI